ncbi:Glycosyl transferases group 1 [Rhizobium sp. RU35A]|uniref:sulfotransferase n=1 Tax=Rhizobium sp. RU35A TaxID=1907414 RepID=UPI000955A4D4|nr:sulfotransferase [Rhizobium sp. RU35A]SIQ52556.1 Glycosyl transferases group 1 [Rhizobium sp. RU35A]
MADILITGFPRSGTTLVASLLNTQPDVIALAEPFALPQGQDREGAVEHIRALMHDYRSQALAGSPLVTKHMGGRIPDNWVEPPKENGGLRRVLEERGALLFDKPLTDDFTLVAKHPAEFTALADLLVDHFPLYAVVRDPLAVMAAWQTVDMPINRGRMPMLERLAPTDWRVQLDAIEEPLERQVKLLSLQLQTYLSLPKGRLLRYEDLIANPRATLAPICPGRSAYPEQSAFDPVQRYVGVDFSALAKRLMPLLPMIEEIYPDFARRWEAYLPARTVAPVAEGSLTRQMPIPVAPHTTDPPRVFVMGAYIPAGGTRMAYEIGHVASEDMGFACYAVKWGHESPEQSFFDYPASFASVDRTELAGLLRPQDLLVCNPSFSNGSVGLTHHCRKLMYVQGFNTFSTLDCWFDRHVAVGSFVQDFLANIYGVEAPVIAPFVSTRGLTPTDWWNREPDSIWLYLKGEGGLQIALVARLREELRRIDPAAEAAIDWEGSILRAGEYRQHDLLRKLGERRHLVSLSICEGFGLVPLEAMALGTMVLGFDGFGGRDYARPGVNCRVQPYPNLAGIAQDLVHCLRHPESTATIASHGPATAARYSQERFRESWRRELALMLGR